ncbi:MAG: MazG nucleotide pyrophosphohydrolase domain-containing protein [Solirubrobacteraceae bacterium]
MTAPTQITDALGRLDALTRRLRAECPWDREQDERSIVPHTVEEAYELADAANSGDDAKLLDELGDVLFQVHFLALLLEERGAGDLGAVAEHCRRKLVRRHPHVFPAAGSADPVEVGGASDVLRNWDQIKATEAGREQGIFGEVPENLPALLYARKLQRRAASAGLARRAPDAPEPAACDDAFHDVGERLFAAVDEARRLRVDPELALRAASQRFRARTQSAQGDP